MSNYTTYNNLAEQKLANTSEIFYDEEMKRQEANNTVKAILRMYDIREFRRKDDITFDSDGLASKPSDYFKMKKLYEVDANGILKNEFHFHEPDELDTQASTAAHWWTEDWDEDASAFRLRVYPADSGTVKIRYIARPVSMDDATTDCGLPADWDEAVAWGMIYRLYQNAGRYEESMNYKQTYQDALGEAWQATVNIGGIKANNRVKSKYERVSLLGNFSTGNYDCDRAT